MRKTISMQNITLIIVWVEKQSKYCLIGALLIAASKRLDLGRIVCARTGRECCGAFMHIP